MPTKKEEDDLIKSQKESAKAFSDAAKELKAAALSVQENSLREELGLTKAALAAKIGDKILGNGFKRTIFNFMLDKKRSKQLQKESGLTKAEYKALKEAEKSRKKELNEAKARETLRKARDAALKETLGEEQAAIRIQALNAEDNSQIIADAQIQAEASKTQDDKEAADAAEAKRKADELAAKEEGQINSLTEAANSITAAFTDSDIAASFQSFADSLQTVISASGTDSVAGQELGAGQQSSESPAERDQERQENERWKSTQLDLLRQIAESITGSGGAGSSDSGDSGLTGLGAGIAGLGKGIGVFIKAVGSGAGKLIASLAKGFAALGKALGPIGKGIGKAIAGILRGFASGVMAFANPVVIGGLAIFTLGMIGLGTALRIAAPAFEAIAPVIIKIADVIGNVLMTAIIKVPEIFRSIGDVIKEVGGVIIGIIEGVGGAVAGTVTAIADGIATVINAVKGDKIGEAKAATELLEAQTASVERLSKIDSTVMTKTALGIKEIGKSLENIGIEGTNSLIAFDKAIRSINGLDATKIGLLNQIKLPKISPPTADEYERIFKTMQETQPNLIQSISGMFSNAFGGKKVGSLDAAPYDFMTSKIETFEVPDDVTGGGEEASSGNKGPLSRQRNDMRLQTAAAKKYGNGNFIPKGSGNNKVFIPASNHPYVLAGKGDPANDSIRSSRDSMRKMMQADAVVASGSNQSSGQANVNAPTIVTDNSNKSSVNNNYGTPHSTSPSNRTSQLLLANNNDF
jgi:hypothetical protein